MTKLFRIVKQSDFFIVQKKFLWFWLAVRQADPAGQPRECPASFIIRFKSIELAREYIQGFLQQPPFQAQEVVEYYKIKRNMMYTSKNEF